MGVETWQPDLLSFWMAVVIALLVGALAVFIFEQRRIERMSRELRALGEEKRALEARLAAEEQAEQQKMALLRGTREDLARAFAQLSSSALKVNNELFLQLAGERFEQIQARAKSDFERRDQALQGLVKPVAEALSKTERELARIENARQQAYGAVTQHLSAMAETQRELQSETRNLVQALRRPEVRGRWGELTLKRLVELAGMVQHCDFVEQETANVDGRQSRPDMIVRLPNRREVIVDAKTPLDAYLSAIESPPEETAQHLTRHARGMRARVRELAAKSYWAQFERSPEFVVLFVPGDQFLSAALDHDASLLEDAMAQRVVLATPTSLIGLLRAIAYGWQQQAISENAEQIRDLGQELYKRVATLTEHLGRLGKSLNGSVEQFNRAVGSLNRQVLPSLRRFPEMGIQATRELEEPEPIDARTRTLDPGGETAADAPLPADGSEADGE
ncbi:MAG: DNA recombination protein RmuC [Chromatiales bacterium]|nr:DNA recombination protein RmuC [Chromatiales bacterium]